MQDKISFSLDFLNTAFADKIKRIKSIKNRFSKIADFVLADANFIHIFHKTKEDFGRIKRIYEIVKDHYSSIDNIKNPKSNYRKHEEEVNILSFTYDKVVFEYVKVTKQIKILAEIGEA